MYLRLIDARADNQQRLDHNRNVAQTLTKEFRKSLTVDTHWREEFVAEYIGACLYTLKGIPSYL